MLRIGALATFTVSAEESYQESLECWIDARSRLPLTAHAVARLQRAPVAALSGMHRAIPPSAV